MNSSANDVDVDVADDDILLYIAHRTLCCACSATCCATDDDNVDDNDNDVVAMMIIWPRARPEFDYSNSWGTVRVCAGVTRPL